MIVPSIDLQSGRAVQLRRGETLIIDAGDPRPIAEKFGRVGEVAVIDLDAAKGEGDNAALIRELLPLARCRVGGGIRTAEAARAWLDAGAHKVILGTAATPGVLGGLPRERTIAALDARDGEVVVEGWRKATGRGIAERIGELRDHVGGFLITFVEIEGTMSGLSPDRVRPLLEAARGVPITAAGGIRTPSEVAALDRLGVDAQVGMAVYSGAMHIADALAACLTGDRPDGLWPTAVCDEAGVCLGLTYSNTESLRAALDEGRGVYWSRRRGLWRKGEDSGHAQHLLRVDADCDRDALRFTVAQSGPFCHTGTRTCYGPAWGIAALTARLEATARAATCDPGSYTARLLREPELLDAKTREEADELCRAEHRPDIIRETADLIYFTLVRLAREGVALAEVARELDRRALRLSRRPGNAKP